MEISAKIDAGGWLSRAIAHLAHSDDPALEAQLLIANVFDKPRASVLAHPEWVISENQLGQLDGLLARLEAGEPLPYLLGAQEFYGMQFAVNPGVLIPRPETELMVETALDWLRNNPQRRFAADVGTGSGCIAGLLAVKIPDLTLIVVDRSWKALETARKNFIRHRVQNQILQIQTDLLTSISTRFDLVCANLPYIPTATLQNLAVCQYEPIEALDGGRDGLTYISRLLQDAPRWMANGGLLLLEIEASQGESCPTLADEILGAGKAKLILDLAGRPRLVKVQF